MKTKQASFPTIEQLLASNVSWLLEAVDTKEAARTICVPEATLITWRSRPGVNTPRFFNPSHTRVVRYIRLELYRWLMSGGHISHVGGIGAPISIPNADNDNEEDA